jgi:7-carboxy-7-deazaguanine synthase
MTYRVKEIYYTLQGEGTHTGRAAVFCRFTSCNLWTGRERDRERAVCRFCDTDFVGTDGPGGGRFAGAGDLAAAVSAAWDRQASQRKGAFVVCTGGEPLLQLDQDAVELKLVYPQEGAGPEMFEDLGFPRLLLQPMDGPERDKNTRLAVEYCLAHPRWRLSLQTHKYLGIA